MEKINNINEKIESTLLKRKQLLIDSENMIKKIINTDKNIYEDINCIDNINNMIELDRKIMVYINEFYIISNRYKKLKDNKDFQQLYFNITETEDLINAYKEYYNEVAKKYNKLIRFFPFSIIYRLKGMKEKLFFDRPTNKDSEI